LAVWGFNQPEMPGTLIITQDVLALFYHKHIKGLMLTSENFHALHKIKDHELPNLLNSNILTR
jgi:hypothetical protein